MQNRKSNGQYAKGKIPLKLIFMLVTIPAAIVGILYMMSQPREPGSVVHVEDTIMAQEAQEDPRIAEYLASEEAKLQAKLAIYEKDRVEAIKINKENNAQIEADYQNALKTEKERHAKELFKINGNLDEVRKQQLGNTQVKGN